MAKIYSKIANYNAVEKGIEFVNGVAEVDDDNKEVLDFYRARGYKIEQEQPDADDELESVEPVKPKKP